MSQAIHKRLRRSGSGGCTAGFTLIELMVSMVLGMIVIAGVVSVFVAGKQSYTTNEALGDVQDSSRIAFELMARDIRNAGFTGCNRTTPVANVLNNGPFGDKPDPDGDGWYADLDRAVRGYTGTQADPAAAIGTSVGDRVAKTDSIELVGAGGEALSIASHDENSAVFHLNETSDLTVGDIVVVCDPTHTSITQVTGPSAAKGNDTVVHNSGGKLTPGNCSKGLGYPPICSGAATGNTYQFPANSQLSRLSAVDWYIGNNPEGGKSLYRKSVAPNASGNIVDSAQEMVRNVTDMSLAYHQATGTDFLAASSITDWDTVDAVRTTLTLESAEQRAGTDAKPLTRSFSSTTTLRNRVE